MDAYNILFVTHQEWQNYEQKSRYSNKIRRFWKRIIRSLPAYLKGEVSRKATKLIKQNLSNYSITGVTPYKFVTEGASAKLQNALDEFTVFVEQDVEGIVQ